MYRTWVSVSRTGSKAGGAAPEDEALLDMVVQMAATMRALALAGLSLLAAAHSNVLIPRPRNAIDALTDPRFGSCGMGKGCAPLNNGEGHCAYGASCGCVCVNGTEPCNIGQTCFWFNQGCSIGCPTCTGVKARAQVDICGNGMKARVCDERIRTYNAMAPCNSDKDTYKHNPWRAPGTAPGESLFTRSAML